MKGILSDMVEEALQKMLELGTNFVPLPSVQSNIKEQAGCFRKKGVSSCIYRIVVSKLKHYSLSNLRVTATQLISWASEGI